MKAVVLCVLAVIAVASARPESYTDRYDTIDVDQVLTNKKLLAPYVKCALDQGKCTAEGRELKSHIKEALENNCGKCTKAQREGTRKVIAHLINHESDYWNQLTAKYDPSRKYVVKYESDLRTAKVQG